MKLFSRDTFKVILIEACVLIAGLAGVFCIYTNVNKFFQEYNTLFQNSTYNQQLVQEIEAFVRQEQIYTSDYIIADNAGKMAILEHQKNLNRDQLNKVLNEFGVIMESQGQKVLYHQLLASCRNLSFKTDEAFSIKKKSGRDAAMLFYSSAQNDFNVMLNSIIQKISTYVEDEMVKTKVHISEHKKSVFKFAAIICSVILLSILLSIFKISKMANSLENKKDNLADEVRRKTIQVSSQNLRLIDLQRNTIHGMANLIESRNGETGGHVKRTSQYVEMIVKKLRAESRYPDLLTDRYIEQLVKAAPMHDVGKIMIPDSILTKPGRLTPEEFEVMKKHSSEGARIVRDVLGKLEDEDYVRIASNVAFYHHEKWDGTGYPKKLLGDDIPLCARIMAVADVFDALVSERCYKKAMNPEEAFEIIKDSAGSHFDPEIAALFISMKEQILEVLSGE